MKKEFRENKPLRRAEPSLGIKAIFFDAGGVLVSIADFEDEHAAEALHVNRRKFDIIAARFSDLCEEGKISDNEFLKRFSREFELDLSFVRKVWLKTYEKELKINKSAYRLAFALKKKGYKIGVISNTKKIYTAINNKKKVYSGFSPVLLSYEVRIMKPNKKIYSLACMRAKVKPSEAVFIDDRIVNVKGARAFGMKAILYKNVQQLEKELRKLKVKF